MTGVLTGNVTGIVTGNCTGSSGSCTGNAATSTVATTVTVADESSDAECFPLFTPSATGNQYPKSGSNLKFNSSTGALTATSFSGDGSNLTGVGGTSGVLAYQPGAYSTGQAINSGIGITFNTGIIKGTGNLAVAVWNTSTGAAGTSFQNIDITSSDVIVSGSSVSIPSAVVNNFTVKLSKHKSLL